MSVSFIDILRNEIRCSVRVDEPLKDHTTYRTGGSADILVTPDDGDALRDVIAAADRVGLSITVIGAGSNVIAPDTGIGGVTVCNVIKSGGVGFSGRGRVRVDSGVMLEDLVRAAASRGLGGFEGVMGIPGTVGGAIVMNAGTDRGTISEYLESVDLADPHGNITTRSAGEIGFGYRKSDIQGTSNYIIRADFVLPEGDGEAILKELARVWDDRRKKFPLDLPSAGSVFKRPEGDFAGRLIEEAGCKGLNCGGAMVSGKHANFIVNTGEASSSDIMGLIAMVKEKVLESSGIRLDLEQILLEAK